MFEPEPLIEPEPAAEPEPRTELIQAEPPTPVRLLSVLPKDFPLITLLQFLPDVRLKKKADTRAAELLSVDVTTPNGLALADERMADVRDVIEEIEECFKDPTDLANQLHKRMTGLRGEFSKAASDALIEAGKRVFAETRKREAAAAEAARKAQEEANAAARAAAARASARAKETGAPVAVQRQLDTLTETATAPPVAATSIATQLSNSLVVGKWKAKLAGAPDTAPQPAMTGVVNSKELEAVRTLLASILQGNTPMIAVEINWSYLNKRAAAEKSALSIPGIEVYEDGGTRKKR